MHVLSLAAIWSGFTVSKRPSRERPMKRLWLLLCGTFCVSVSGSGYKYRYRAIRSPWVEAFFEYTRARWVPHSLNMDDKGKRRSFGCFSNVSALLLFLINMCCFWRSVLGDAGFSINRYHGVSVVPIKHWWRWTCIFRMWKKLKLKPFFKNG